MLSFQPLLRRERAPRFRQERGRLLRLFAHVLVEGLSFCGGAKMLQQVSEPLRPGDRCCPGSGGKFFWIDPLGAFRQNLRQFERG
jgi:hypothetical protein